ncbi:MAG TPA: hypothetical protein DEQ14_06890 [Treponema sp.]|nr:hypothetical protein [Treponema sp.]
MPRSWIEQLSQMVEDEYLKVRGQKIHGDGLKNYWEKHNLPKTEISYASHPKYEQSEKLFSITYSYKVLRDWYNQNTPIGYDEFDKLLGILSELTGEQIDPHNISSEYLTKDDIFKTAINFESEPDFRLPFLKIMIFRNWFVSLHHIAICKLILYLDVLEVFDLLLFEFACMILGMNESGQIEAKKNFSKRDCFSLIENVKKTYSLLELREKIKSNQVEKEAHNYWHDFVKRNINTIPRSVLEDETQNEESTAILYNALWADFTPKIDSLYYGYNLGKIECVSFFPE